MQIDFLALGEYNTYAKRGGKLHDLTNGLPLLVSGQSAFDEIMQASGCLHHMAALTLSGIVLGMGDNHSANLGFATPAARGLGAVPGMPASRQVIAYANAGDVDGLGYGIGAVTKNDELYLVGNTQGGFKGDGSAGDVANPTPFKVPIGAVDFAAIGTIILAAMKDGTVLSWGGGVRKYYPTYLLCRGVDNPDFTKPAPVAGLSGPAKQIVIGADFGYILCQDGQLFAFAYNTKFIGYPNTPGQNKVFNITSRFPGKIAKIGCNSVASFVILDNGDAYAWGDAACGTIGNGQHKDFSPGFAWDWGQMEMPVYQPVQIGKGVKWAEIYSGNGAVFYTFLKDVDGNIASFGRNKNFNLGDGIGSTNSDEQANLPNSWDQPYITYVDPFALTGISDTKSPKNKIAAAPGALLATAISDKGSAVISLAASMTGAVLNRAVWSQVSGPAVDILLPSGKTAIVKNAPVGSYVFSVTGVDANWNKVTQSVSVDVVAADPIPVPDPSPTPAQPRKVVKVVAILPGGITVELPASACAFTFDDGTVQ